MVVAMLADYGQPDLGKRSIVHIPTARMDYRSFFARYLISYLNFVALCCIRFHVAKTVVLRHVCNMTQSFSLMLRKYVTQEVNTFSAPRSAKVITWLLCNAVSIVRFPRSRNTCVRFPSRKIAGWNAKFAKPASRPPWL